VVFPSCNSVTGHTSGWFFQYPCENTHPAGVAVGVGVTLGVAEGVGVVVAVAEGVAVGLTLGVAVAVAVGVGLGETVGVAVGVTVGVALGDAVGVGVGLPQVPPICRSYSVGLLLLPLMTTTCAGPGRPVYET